MKTIEKSLTLPIIELLITFFTVTIISIIFKLRLSPYPPTNKTLHSKQRLGGTKK